MATVADWISGARLRTLPLAIAPVFLGSAVASLVSSFELPLALLALVVSLSLQVGVNYANDYSDGIRGTDDNRVGPKRLTGGKLATPRAVLTAAIASFLVAAVSGLAIIFLTGHYWLLVIGLLAILAAWYYTGGKKPYGYQGMGEIVVFIFFGPVATIGTSFIQSGVIQGESILLGTGLGLIASAVLVANNLRDVDTDRVSGKKTVSVVIGKTASRWLFGLLIWIPLVLALPLVLIYPATILGWLMLLPAIAVTVIVAGAKSAKELILVLKLTSYLGLGYALLFGFGLIVISF